MARSKRKKLDAFTRGYLEAALWTASDEDGEPIDSDYYIEDFSDETVEGAIADCDSFQEENADALDETEATDARNGHDFWMSRNRHGTGFWDRGYGSVGDHLQQAAEDYGEAYVVVGDDDLLYIEG